MNATMSSRSSATIITACTLIALAVSGCGDETSVTPSEGGPMLVTDTDVPGNEDCPFGIRRIEAGLDNGDDGGTAADGVLQPGEIDQRLIVCLFADETLTAVDVVDPGDDCPLGGARILTGVDNGDGGEVAGDGVLDQGEVDESEIVCRTSAPETLADATPLAVGDDDCAHGGTRIDYGLDNGDGNGTAGNDTLEAGEVDGSTFACNDAPAEPSDVVGRATDLAAGDANCPFGGTRVDFGVDDGRGEGTANDGVLHDAEVDGTDYACLDAESGLVVNEIELPSGDETCPAGGRRIESGRDDGEGGATAGDGILDAGEVDATLTQCDIQIEEVFEPAPTGEPGTGFIEAIGGNGDGAAGGQGGDFVIQAYTGGLPTAVVLTEAGELEVPDPPTRVPELGDNPLLVTTAIDVEPWDGDGEAPDVYYNTAIDQSPYPIYAEDTRVTGIEIQSAGVLGLDEQAFELEADLINNGLIGSLDSTSPSQLTIAAANIVNGQTGTIDAVGSSTSGDVILYAVSEGGVVINQGFILSHGHDDNGSAASTTLYGEGDVVNTGTIDTHGDSGNGRFGEEIALMSRTGNVYNTGALIASGGSHGDGNGGHGGDVFLTTASIWEVEVELLGLDEEPLFLPGNVYNSGSVTSTGGAATAGNGGEGGDVHLFAIGGGVTTWGPIDTSGGPGDSGGYGGGDIIIEALIHTDPVTLAVTAPTTLRVGGDLSLNGGDATGEGGSGGHAGDLHVLLNATALDPDEPREQISREVYPISGDAFSASTDPVRIELVGFGQGINLSGGFSSGGDPDTEVNALPGTVDLRVQGCPGDDADPVRGCLLGDHLGFQWLYNDVDISARFGATDDFSLRRPNSPLTFSLGTGPAVVLRSADESLLENYGDLDVGGGSSTSGNGAYGADVLISAPFGAIVNRGDITTASGSGCDGCERADSGDLTVVGMDVDFQADYSAGGQPTGYAGSLIIRGLDVHVEGTFVQQGDDVMSSEAADLLGGNAGWTELTGAHSLWAEGTFLQSGGDAVLTEDAVSGSVTGGEGGLFRAVAPVMHLDATVELDAGSALGAHSGSRDAVPGFVRSFTAVAEVGDFAGSYSVSAGGISGDHPDPSVFARGGGEVWLYGSDITNHADITSNGGGEIELDDSGTSSGGAGGEIIIAGDNDGDLTAVGADADGGTPTGGAGGQINIFGDNGGCLLVTGGSPGGSAGMIEVGGADTGSCL